MAKTPENSKRVKTLYFAPGSQVHTLLSVISVTGEYPLSSVHLLGSESYNKALISKLQEKHKVVNCKTGETVYTKLLSVCGKSENKTVRILKTAIPILKWFGAENYYRTFYDRYPFRGDAAHLERNHRVAEAVAMSMRAGFEYRPYKLPMLQNSEIKKVVSDSPSFYTSKMVKSMDPLEMDKTMFTRTVGMMFSGKDCYAVYNTRSAVMKWCGKGELKARYSLTDIARLNSDVYEINSAVLFGNNYDIALMTILESDKNRRHEFRFDDIYRHIHFIPLSEFGIRKLRIMSVPNWKERILELLFDADTRSYDRGNFEYDAYIDGRYIFSFLDGDIARLIRFKRAVETGLEDMCEILCFPEEKCFIRTCLPDKIRVKTLQLSVFEKSFGI